MVYFLLRVFNWHSSFWLGVKKFSQMVVLEHLKQKGSQHIKGPEKLGQKKIFSMCTILFEIIQTFWKMWACIFHIHGSLGSSRTQYCVTITRGIFFSRSFKWVSFGVVCHIFWSFVIFAPIYYEEIPFLTFNKYLMHWFVPLEQPYRDQNKAYFWNSIEIQI